VLSGGSIALFLGEGRRDALALLMAAYDPCELSVASLPLVALGNFLASLFYLSFYLSFTLSL